jgi:hypothetical protein
VKVVLKLTNFGLEALPVLDTRDAITRRDEWAERLYSTPPKEADAARLYQSPHSGDNTTHGRYGVFNSKVGG